MLHGVIASGVHPLDDARSKLSWARRHTYALHAEIVKLFFDAFAEPEGDKTPVSVEFEAETSSYVLKVDWVPEIPRFIGLMMGDAVHGLRSALDHLAWQLVLHGEEPEPERPQFVQFPIYGISEAFRDNIDRRLPSSAT
jgi:hypothetical protein